MDLHVRETRLLDLSEALSTVDQRLRSRTELDVRTAPTGFPVLDGVLSGGLHVGELLLLGGAPGVGKTIMALQMARNIAKEGGQVLFACYEHEPTVLLTRLLSMEAGFRSGDKDALARTVQNAMEAGDLAGRTLEEVLAETPGGIDALESVRSYQDRFIFVEASGARTTTEALAKVVSEKQHHTVQTVLFVDYLQKIPLHPEPETEAEKTTRTVEALKDLALEEHLTVVLLSAVDTGGMHANRVRIHHLRGSSAAAFEADVVLMLNDKHKAVAKIHLTYDPVRAATFKNYLLVSVEKNRGGPSLVDLEFRKDYTHYRLDPEGGYVSEKLVDERLDEEMV